MVINTTYCYMISQLHILSRFFCRTKRLCRVISKRYCSRRERSL